MAYQSGEIYFIREQDGSTLSPYVKIGLVRYADGRDSFNRVVEHQTGNPRRLVLTPDHIVKTEAVDMVEAQMHRIFAASRVSGEWFFFDADQDVQVALAKARELAADAAQRVPLFDQASAFEKQLSSGDLIAATPELARIANRLAMQKGIVKIASGLLDDIQEKLRFAAESGADVSGVAKTVIRTLKPKLDEEAVKAAHPELYEKYLVEVTKFSGSFLLKAKGLDIDADLAHVLSELSKLDVQIESVTEHADIAMLNEPSLAVRSIKGIAEWEADLLKAELQIATGTTPGIEGLCTWNRVNKTTSQFDAATFADENPDIAKQHMIVREPKTYINPTHTKAE